MEVEGRLEGLQPYAIHGTRYYRVFYSHADAPDEILRAQLPFDAIDADVKPGDPITVSYLLNTVVAVARRTG
ncbi:MAG: hypothetical protein AVDCRST_MAG49-1287 [uncultured Thermomicrobiales bacterium]|uniref:Uncharacterized protein n=1 Tax=uncultured Thermomicrobiales bacterium TaxID=1645740 RepID=A0A6J4U915_9BACT|nr:MAG: hypothetical protein AVDCRST_MAG49-1287 [uncultured Thermomicrobiales bacterium]